MLRLPIVMVALTCAVSADSARAQLDAALTEAVSELFAARCAIPACHSGPQPMLGLSLEAGQFLSNVIDVPSTERPDLRLVRPGKPDSSYLVMKVRGDEGIIGLPMPFSGDRLSEEEIASIEAWVESMDEDVAETLEPPQREVYPFPGWKVVNLPTARALPRQTLLFLISHRFLPEVGRGYESFFGLDGPGLINISLGYALTSRLLLAVSRSNELANVETQLRYQILRQGGPRGSPIDLSAQGGLNWLTADRESIRERTKLSLQVSATHALPYGVSLALVPGLLTNPAEEVEGEQVLVTLGLGGRWELGRNLALVAEWVPMLSGYTRTTTVGLLNRYDHFGGGLEVATAGHVFQIVVTNSLGLSTDQYLRGGDLDILDGDFRLGFNIFRMINL